MSFPDNAFDMTNVPLTNCGKQGGQGIAVNYGGRIQYAIPDENDSLIILSSDPSGYQKTHSISQLNTWSKTAIADLLPGNLKNNAKIAEARFITAASVGGYNYFFWCAGSVSSMDDLNKVMYFAVRTTPDMLTPPSLVRLDLGALLGKFDYITSNIAPFALSESCGEFAGQIGAIALALDGKDCVVPLMVFDPADFVANTPWKARFISRETNKPDNAAIKLGSNSDLVRLSGLSAGLADQGLLKTANDAELRQYVTVVATCSANDGGKTKTLSFGFDLLEGLFLQNSSATGGQITLDKGNDDPIVHSATIQLAPDGNLLVLGREANNKVRVAKLVLNTVNDQPGMASAQWRQLQLNMNADGRNITSNNTPAAFFVPLATTEGTAPCNVYPPSENSPNARTEADITYKPNNCPQTPYIFCALTSAEGNVPLLNTAYWGTFFTVKAYQVFPATDEYKKVMLLNMVADTFPYPVPHPSLAGPDSPLSGNAAWRGCQYEYLVGHDDETSVEYKSNVAIGWKAGLTATVLVGVKAEAEGAAGFSKLSSNSQTTHQASAYVVTTKGVPRDLATGATNDASTLAIAGQGAFFGTNPPVRVESDLGVLRMRGANTVSDRQTVMLRPVDDTSNKNVAGDYASYCYTPGNLLTYDPMEISKTMGIRYARLTYEQKKAFIINGEDFGYLYADTTGYLQKISDRFGTPSFGPEGNLPYLEFSFSETGAQRSGFQSTTAFKTGSGSFLNNSAYAGAAWDIEIETGISLGFEISTAAKTSGYVMAGVKFDSSLEETKGTSDSWGINLSEYYGSLAPGESYTARLYLLKPSPLWAVEMKYMGFPDPKTPIDFGCSAPVRILFTVPYISDALRQRLLATFPQ